MPATQGQRCASNRGKKKRVSPEQQQLPFVFDIRLNQIPDDWHQVAARFRRANGIHDGDRERRIWQLRWGNKYISREQEWRCIALLWVELFEIYLGRRSGSRLKLVMQGPYSARIWRVLGAVWA
jgi:hypothetical protein